MYLNTNNARPQINTFWFDYYLQIFYNLNQCLLMISGGTVMEADGDLRFERSAERV